MADPIIPGGYRCLAIQHSVTALPADVIVNAWSFNIPTEPEPDFEAHADALAYFYEGMEAHFRPDNLVAERMEFRYYDLGQPAPREPLTIERDVNRSSAGGLPEEVAVSLSFYADRNLPRNRGRLFLGPLAFGAFNISEGRARVTPTFAMNVAAAATTFRNQSLALGFVWCVLSQRDEELKPITHGWVDDALDTIRSRGTAPQTRVLWPVED